MAQYVITLDAIAEETLDHIMETRSNRTREQVVMQIVERGMYQLDYRTLRNRRVYAENKELNKQARQLLK